MSGEAKVLTGLLQRRALEQAFAELGRLSDPAAVQRQAQTIAGYGSAALQHLLTLLDTPDPQLRGGLGQVARQLPREQVVSALRGVVRDQHRSDQARLGAVTLLERFLGETVENSAISNLGDPNRAAQQSLRELIAAMDLEPLSVVEYLEQLGQQPPDVVGLLLNAVPGMEPDPAGAGAHLVTFLRMLAQGEDVRVARRAVDELAKMKTPAAVRALASLVPNLPPDLAPIAERGLRKLRFSGVRESDDHEPAREPWYAPELAWRALISPLDPTGAQFLWFVGADAASAHAVFFTVLTQDGRGVRDASGSLDAEPDHAPPKRREGALHYIVGDGSAPGVTLLEAPLSLARLTLGEALAQNWASGEATPVGYRLFSPLIWLSQEAEDQSDSATDAFTVEPDLTLADIELAAALDHPAFYGWFVGVHRGVLAPDQEQAYVRRFRVMSRWLATAGDEIGAQLAATLAYHIENKTPQASAILAAASLKNAATDGQEQQDQS